MANNSLIKQFEKDLKTKVEQKQVPNLNPEQTIIKYFKYFDLENSGFCSLRDWIKSLEKIGVYFNKVSDIQDVFNYYDTSKSGKIDYKAFSKNICSGFYQLQDEVEADNDGFKKLDSILSERGGMGLLELYKEFKIFDVNNSKKVGIDDFIKCITNHQVNLSVQEIQALFNAFEILTNGQFFYEDMFNELRAIYWNKERDSLVDKFVNNYLIFTVKDLVHCFNGSERDSFVAFAENYNFIKNLSNNNNTVTFSTTGEEVKEFLSFFCYGVENNSEVDEFLVSNFKKNDHSSNAPKDYDYEINKNSNNLNSNSNKNKGFQNLNNKKAENQSKGVSSSIDQASPELKKFIAKLKSIKRLPFIQMLKCFRNYDNETKFVNKIDFMKVIKDLRINLTFNDIEALFETYSDQKSRLLNHKSFIQKIVLEPLPTEIERPVDSIFDKLAGLESSTSIEIMKENFQPTSNHPMYLSNNSLNDIIMEFFDSFETFHYQYLGAKSSYVNRDELKEFYQITYFINNDIEKTLDCLYDEWGVDKKEKTKKNQNKNKYTVQEDNSNNNYESVSPGNTDNIGSKNKNNQDSDKLRGKGQSHMRNKSSLKLGSDNFEMPKSTLHHNIAKNNYFNNDNNGQNNINTEPKTTKERQLNGSKSASRIQVKNSGNATPQLIETNNYNYKSKKPNLKLDEETVVVNNNSPLDQLIAKLRNRGIRGLMHFHKEFIQSNISKITLNEFTKIFKLQKLDLSKSSINQLFETYSKDKRFLDFHSLFLNFKLPLEGQRLAAVENAFSSLDKEGTGVVGLDDVKIAFIPNKYFGENLDIVGLEFVDTFELANSIVNDQNTGYSSLISFQEFANYFEYVAFAIKDERTFISAVTQAFN